MTQPKAKENKEKRVLKTEPRLKVDLNEEQKEFVSKFKLSSAVCKSKKICARL